MGTVTALTSDSYAQGRPYREPLLGGQHRRRLHARARRSSTRSCATRSPATPGNQEMVEVVAAGNSGSAANTVASLGAAKNVIAVGAAESVRTGPVPALRAPMAAASRIWARTTRTTSSASRPAGPRTTAGQAGRRGSGHARHRHAAGRRGYNGSGVCTSGFPAGSTLYNLSSGTSHSAPVVTGMAALFREWFRQNRGGGTVVPSPALTKAALANAATDLDGGDGTAGHCPQQQPGLGPGQPGAVARHRPALLPGPADHVRRHGRRAASVPSGWTTRPSPCA